MARLEEDVRALEQRILIRAIRITLQTRGAEPSPAMLRGAFGAALHDQAPRTYDRVFAPGRGTPRGVPLYLLRSAPPACEDQLSLELVLFGAACDAEADLRAAWDLAARRGLGPDRRCAEILEWWPLRADRSRATPGECLWRLDQVPWPLAGDSAYTPCRLLFPGSLRILRRKRLCERPTLRDLVVAGCRRLGGLLPAEWRGRLQDYTGVALAAADGVATCPWVGGREDLRRWSASQRKELELRGVSGHLDLPEGPGPLRALLAALLWLNVGKGTVIGLGQMKIVTPW